MDTSPKEYLDNLASDIEQIVRDNLVKSRTSQSKKIMMSVLGIGSDPWGEVTGVSQTLANEIHDRINPDVLERWKVAIVQDCEKEMEKFASNPNNPLRKELRNRMEYFIKRHVERAMDAQSERVSDVVGRVIGGLVDERLEKDLAAWRSVKALESSHD